MPKGAGDAIDGRAIAVATLDDGSRRQLVQTDDPIWHPELSPDATRIAYQVNGVIHVIDVDSAENSSVTDGTQAVWLDDDTLLVPLTTGRSAWAATPRGVRATGDHELIGLPSSSAG